MRIQNIGLYSGKAVEVKQDPYHGELIKVRLEPEDTKRSDDQLPYAFPLIPKMLHVKPKVGEDVAILMSGDGINGSQRYYIGPIISQAQKLFYEPMSSATRLLANGAKNPLPSIDNRGVSNGTMPEDDDVALLGRKNSDVILSDDEVKIRAGVRIPDTQGNKLDFNRDSPAFIKLKYHEIPLKSGSDDDPTQHGKTKSTATIFADKINLLSPNGDGFDSLESGESAGELIGDEKMKKLMETAHRLPYGDILCDFLSQFLNMYMNHSHPYPGLPPLNGDPDSAKFWAAYSPDKKSLENKLLSKDIKIN